MERDERIAAEPHQIGRGVEFRCALREAQRAKSIASLLGAIRLGRLVADARVCTETQSMTGNDKTSRATRLAPDEGDDDAAISDDGLRPQGVKPYFQ
jgi:hypothetical protein